MTKLLKIIAFFLLCRLAWIWVDRCGENLGLGEALPFCLECSGLATIMRLVFLGVAVWGIQRELRSPPAITQIYEDDMPPAHSYRIYWHRIGLLLGILTYPLWAFWVDANTAIPGPGDLPILSAVCSSPGFKGTLLWAVVLVFLYIGLKILHRR